MLPEVRFFVGNLPEDIDREDLQSAFSKFGDVTKIDIKDGSHDEPRRNFGFVTLSAPDTNVESCLNYFASQDLKGNKIYVARARESFLERLQKERAEANSKFITKALEAHALAQNNPIINIGDKQRTHERRVEDAKQKKYYEKKNLQNNQVLSQHDNTSTIQDSQTLKKLKADKKRLESLKKKRQEFNNQRNIIKSDLIEIDKAKTNKKIRFHDNEDEPQPDLNKYINKQSKTTKNLFEDEDSGDEVTFEIKKQFEGRRGQKVLDLQSSYKSDKRFTLDERFVEDEDRDEKESSKQPEGNGETDDQRQEDEKLKQLNILQDVLGVSIKTSVEPSSKKTKSKLGMLRFDPTHPEHSKFLAPMDTPTDPPQKKAKKKNKEKKDIEPEPEAVPQEVPKVEVSKEQFYKISENLKEVIAQPTTFSLRSLFKSNENETNNDDDNEKQEYSPLEITKTETKKNPLDPTDRNPFVYDSSDSEDEKFEENDKNDLPKQEVKAVWRQTLFFTENDQRLKEGLDFFINGIDNEVQKERRELKSLMKKRIYNRERKNQMFKKKIGGKRKSMKKSFRRKP